MRRQLWPGRRLYGVREALLEQTRRARDKRHSRPMGVWQVVAVVSTSTSKLYRTRPPGLPRGDYCTESEPIAAGGGGSILPHGDDRAPVNGPMRKERS